MTNLSPVRMPVGVIGAGAIGRMHVERFERNVLSARWREDGDLLEFWITADTFMRHMNRVLVGTMLEVATGRRTLEDFTKLLDGRPRSSAGATAPPHGLALASVAYA